MLRTCFTPRMLWLTFGTAVHGSSSCHTAWSLCYGQSFSTNVPTWGWMQAILRPVCAAATVTAAATTHARRELAQMLQLEPKPCHIDFLCRCCCFPCSLCQEFLEVRKRNMINFLFASCTCFEFIVDNIVLAAEAKGCYGRASGKSAVLFVHRLVP